MENGLLYIENNFFEKPFLKITVTINIYTTLGSASGQCGETNSFGQSVCSHYIYRLYNGSGYDQIKNNTRVRILFVKLFLNVLLQAL